MELHFREIKITLALDVLRCLTPAMIEKELLLHIIAYNLIHSLMQRAAILHCVELPRLSFKGTLDTLRHFADAVHALRESPASRPLCSTQCSKLSPPIMFPTALS